MNILHVTNMYPTPQKPYYGIFVERQVKSLQKKGVNCKVKCIGKGFGGYKRILSNREEIDWADLIHCHFGHTGSLALLWKLLKKKPIIVSYCGGDLLGRVEINGKYSLKNKALVFSNSAISINVDCAIAQSWQLAEKVKSKMVRVVPYGVDIDIFRAINKEEAREKIGLKDYDGKVIFFMGQKDNPVKNFILLDKALKRLDFKFTCLSLGNITQEDVAYSMNAADVCVLSSLHEGSPNIVREAMACDRPIVSVGVGDVKDLIDPVTGCFIVRHDPDKMAASINRAISFGSVKARQRLLDLGLDTRCVAEKIISIYKELL